MNPSEFPDISGILAKKRALAPGGDHFLEWLEFLYQRVEKEMGQVRLPAFEMPDGEARLQEGVPLFAPADLPVDLIQVARLLRAFAQARVPQPEAMKTLAEFFTEDSEGKKALTPDILTGNREALSQAIKGLDVDLDLAAFLGYFAIKPSMWALRKKLENILDQEFSQGYCPVCGSAPRMACIESDHGRLTLGCGLCGHQWAYPRIKCPFCETTNPDDLEYLFDEQQQAYRIQACHQCYGYLKIVDLRQAGDPAPLELEDLLTMHLDLVAEENGLTATPEIMEDEESE